MLFKNLTEIFPGQSCRFGNFGQADGFLEMLLNETNGGMKFFVLRQRLSGMGHGKILGQINQKRIEQPGQYQGAIHFIFEIYLCDFVFVL